MICNLPQTPDLASYDVILINSSGGKDSQAMLDYVTELAVESGVQDRIIVIHADLGRVEWEGTKDLAREQAEHYGHRFETVRREKGDLLDQIEARGMWPSSKARYCTSDQKRDQVQRSMTAFVRELGLKRQARILNCMGIRAQESASRAKKNAFQVDKRASSGRRHVDNWLPIFEWSEEKVWDRIQESGVRYHRAYDLGMSRLSCCFCVFASKDDLLISGRENPDLLEEYVAVEKKIQHDFRVGLPILEIKEALDRGERGCPHQGSPCAGCPGM